MGGKAHKKSIKVSTKKAAQKGRPAHFDTPEQLEQYADEYFATCKPSFLMVNGKVALDKAGQPIVEINPPTVTGLALYLGFESRQSLYDYLKKPAFSYTIKKIISRIEDFAEHQLFANAKPTGAIFWLKNHGWKAEEETKQDVNVSASISEFSVDKFLEKFNAEK